MLRQAQNHLALGTKGLLSTIKRNISNFLVPPSGLTRNQLQFWDRHGYLVLRKHFSRAQVAVVNDLVDRLWAQRRSVDSPLVADIFTGTPKQRRVHLRDAPDEARRVPYKLNDLFLEHAEVLALSVDPVVRATIGELFEGEPVVCNSLTLEKGSQQDLHFDTFYMPAPVENKMIASWIALEDAHPDSGPLRYYPGSHKIPAYRFSDGRLQINHDEFPAFERYIGTKLKEFGLREATFKARLGDVFIWHSQLFHGGSSINNPLLTRKSLVTHYFRAEDLPPELVGADATGRQYLKRPHPTVDVETDEPEPN